MAGRHLGSSGNRGSNRIRIDCETVGPGADQTMERASAFNPWLEILNLQLAVSRSAIDAFSSIIDANSSSEPSRSPRGLEWTTAHHVFRELATLSLLDFSVGYENPDDAAALIVAPYALHGGSVADFAPGHSVVEILLREGVTHLFLIDWRSATPERKFDSIDTHLAELECRDRRYRPRSARRDGGIVSGGVACGGLRRALPEQGTRSRPRRRSDRYRRGAELVVRHRERDADHGHR